MNRGEAVYYAQCLVTKLHRALERQGLTGDRPSMNMHFEQPLPICVYHPRTHALSLNAHALEHVLKDELAEALLDAMTVLGCQRDYLAKMRLWNSTQNKGRMATPHLALQGSPRWREIRSNLSKEM